MNAKVAVVTGGNKGIGYAIVKGLCEKYDGIVYMTSRDVARGQNAVKELEKSGLKPKFHQLDITDAGSIAAFKEYIVKTYGGIDVLVNNAAIAFKNDATEPFGVQAEETIRVNYLSLVQVCNQLFPILRANGRVVNLSSSCGHLSKIPSAELKAKLSSPDLTIEQLTELMKEFVKSSKEGKNVSDGWGSSAYNASKVGVSALTRIQQRMFDAEPEKRNISVNCVHPGWVDTDMSSHKGPLSIEEGASAPLFLALNEGGHQLKGQYVWKDKTVADWTTPAPPAPV